MRKENPFLGQSEPLPRAVARAGFHQAFFDLDDVVISYLSGPTAAQPLVLIPAQMGTWTTYAKVMPRLARRFEVFVVEIRGHGNSSWTPGDYSWESCGRDLQGFLTRVVGRPAIISGNSSGGILALWCAANAPDLASAMVLEDPPIFSAEMPRFKDEDRFVYAGLSHVVDSLGDLEHRRLADYFRGLELPMSERRIKRLPSWFIDRLDSAITRYERRNPLRPSGVDAWWLPRSWATSSDHCPCSTLTSPGRSSTDGSSAPSRTRPL